MEGDCWRASWRRGHLSRPEGRALEEKPVKNGEKKEGKREKAWAKARWFGPVVQADRKRDTGSGPVRPSYANPRLHPRARTSEHTPAAGPGVR